MTLRDWTDPRDGRPWKIWLEPGQPTVLVLGSERDLHTVVVDFREGLEDLSDEELQRLLDERGGGRAHLASSLTAP